MRLRLCAALGASISLLSSGALAHDGEPGHTHDAPKPAMGEPVDIDPSGGSDVPDDAGGDEGAPTSPSGSRPRGGGRIPPLGKLSVDEDGDDDDDDDDVAPVEEEPAKRPPPREDVRGDQRRSTLPDSTWRQDVRERDAERQGRTGNDFVELTHFLFEIRFGPY